MNIKYRNKHPSLMDYYITSSIKDSSEIVADMSKTDAAMMLGVREEEYIFPESYHKLVAKLSLSLAVALLNEKGGWTDEIIREVSFANTARGSEDGEDD